MLWQLPFYLPKFHFSLPALPYAWLQLALHLFFAIFLPLIFSLATVLTLFITFLSQLIPVIFFRRTTYLKHPVSLFFVAPFFPSK